MMIHNHVTNGCKCDHPEEPAPRYEPKEVFLGWSARDIRLFVRDIFTCLGAIWFIDSLLSAVLF